VKILVIGGLGFVGSAIARDYIRRGFHVGIATKTKAKEANIYPYRAARVDRVDISKKAPDCRGYDLIIHAASTTHNYNIKDDPHLDVSVNCRGTIKTLEAIVEQNPRARVVYLSTFFVAGKAVRPSGYHDERMPCEPLALYGATKLCAEHICQTYWRTYGVDVRIARLCNVYGPREQTDNPKKAAMNRMLAAIHRGEQVQLYSNAPMRDYIHVDDVVTAVCAIAQRGAGGEVYYVGTGTSTSIRHMLDIGIKYSGRGSYELVDPPPFHTKVGMGDFAPSILKLRSLGWTPKIAAVDGIADTMRSFGHGE